MARYDYKCSSCGNVFEVEHPMSESPEVVCPSCANVCPVGDIKGGHGEYPEHQRLLRQLPAQPLETSGPATQVSL